MDQEHDLIAGSSGRSLADAVSMPDPIVDFETFVVPHANHLEAKAAIGRLHARYKPPGGKRLKARALLICGETGSGKTTALEDYMSDYPDLKLESIEVGEDGSRTDGAKVNILLDGDRRRIVCVEVPEKTTRRALVAALLGAFGYRAREKWNTSDIIEQLEYYTQEMGTEMIFFDEGHHIVSASDSGETETVSEFIKSLLNRIKTQIVIAGLPMLFDVSHYEQLRRRLQPPVMLFPYNWSTTRGRIMFLTILRALERQLSLPEPSGLAIHDFALRIYIVTGGEIGIVSKYLSEALSLARARGLPRISRELMAEVYSSFHQTKEPDDLLDFDVSIDEEEEEKIAAALAIDTNPFLCGDAKLKELWSELQVTSRRSLQSIATSRKDASRKTTLKAKGRSPFTPFTRT